jgi:hypothetical protein
MYTLSVLYKKSKTTIKFVYEHEGLNNDYFSIPPTKIAYTIDGESSIHECITAFENFLLGCGYRLNKGETIDIVEDFNNV